MTYPWLIGTFLTVAGLCLTMLYFTISHYDNRMNQKVDKAVFEYLCGDIRKIEKLVEKNGETLLRVDRNQIKVMQKLNISRE